MRRFIALNLLFLFSFSCFAIAQNEQNIEPDEIVPFKIVTGDTLCLHIFQPQVKRDGPVAAIVFFFGGGWVNGTAAHFYYQSRHLADRGMVVVCAEYRIFSIHGTTPYECVIDGKSAMRWVREHAADLGIDPDRIAAGGGSAGGHVAASTALVHGFEEPGEERTVSSVPDALVLFNPVIDTSEKGYGHEKCGVDWRLISPTHLVRPGLPPTVIFHGTADSTVPFENVERFTRLMTENGNSCTLYPYPGQVHGFFNYGRGENQFYMDTVEKMDRFLSSIGYLTE